MTKAEELRALTEFTQSLPADTYLRPWLESVLPEVEHDIRCDLPVSPSPRQARIESDRIQEDARQHCERVKQRAEEQAENTLSNARSEAARIKSRLCDSIRQCVSTLGFSI